MNAMGHDVPTMIGVNQSRVLDVIDKLVPDYMVMGEMGMADTGSMEMALPDNTLPMMTGQGPYGALEMGGIFTSVQVRRGLARNDFKDPGWFKQPANTMAHEWTGLAPVAASAPEAVNSMSKPTEPILNVIKGTNHRGH